MCSTNSFRKLTAINFPIENSLVIGLAMTALNEMPLEYRMVVPDDKWQTWANEYKAERQGSSR